MSRQLILALVATCAAADAGAEPAALQPFSAVYNIEWRGMGAGTSNLDLVSSGDNNYIYRSRNVARGFFKLAFPGAVTQTSAFSIVDGVVTPASYRADDGSTNTDRDVALQFDWKSGRAHGTAENKAVDVALKPGTQDSLSVQIALMLDVAAGRSPERFWLLDKREIKEYHYTREGMAALDTPLGKLDTVIYRSERDGSTRVTRLWLAPTLGFLPVRAEQIKGGKREFALNVREVKRD